MPGSLRTAMLVLLGLAGLAALFVALTVPYHATDAFVFGTWSRRIAETGGFDFAQVSNAQLSRPLFLAVQGWLWYVFGDHEWIGRLYSLAFAVILVLAIVRLGGRRLGLLAAILLLAVPDFAQGAFAGMTDVPGAALTAVVAMLLWTFPRTRWTMAALVLAAAGAVLAKSSVLPAVVGVGLAHLIGPPDRLRERLTTGCVPVAAGIALALVYDLAQARHLGQGLYTFLTGGNAADPHAAATADFIGQVNEQARQSVVLGVQWLGPYLLLPLIFAVLYGVLRIAGVRHRLAATVAAPAALLASWLLPWLADDRASAAVGPFDTARPAAALATIAFWFAVLFARDCPEEEAPARADLARWAVWIVPTFLAWNQIAPNNTRYLSAVWPPLLLACAAGIWMSAQGLRRRGPVPAAAVLVVALAVAGFDLVRNFDALGARPDGSINALRTVRDLGVTGWFDADRARTAADPQLGGILTATRAAVGPHGRVLTNDGRFGYFFLDRATVRYPAGCGALQGYAALSLVTNTLSQLDPANFDRLAPETREALSGGAPDPARFARCPAPRTATVAAVPGSFAVLKIG